MGLQPTRVDESDFRGSRGRRRVARLRASLSYRVGRRAEALRWAQARRLWAARRGISHCLENTQGEIPRSALDRTVQGSAASKVTSFPRKRESNSPGAEVAPRFRGGDKCLDFHHYGWAARPMSTRNDSLEGFFRSV